MTICVVPKYNTFKKEKKERNVKDSWSGMKSAAQTLHFVFPFLYNPVIHASGNFFSEVIRVSSKNHLF